MKTLVAFLCRLFVGRPRPLLLKRAPLILGHGPKGAQVLGAILACTKPDAIRARQNNYRRSMKRILDSARN